MALWSLFQSAIKASKWPLIKRKWGAPHVVHPLVIYVISNFLQQLSYAKMCCDMLYVASCFEIDSPPPFRKVSPNQCGICPGAA